MQRAFTNTKHVGLERWGPPLVDAVWHVFCPTIYKRIEGHEWEELYCHFLRIEPSGLSQKAE